MKKFGKICLIASAVLILIGGTICVLGFFSGGWRMVNEMEMDDDFWRFVSRFGGEDVVRNIRHEITQEVREEMEDIEEEIRETWEDDIKDDIEEAMDEVGKDVREAILEEFAADIPEEGEDTGIEADKVKKLKIEIGGAALCLMESENNNFGVKIDGKGDYQYYESRGVFHLEGGYDRFTGNRNEKVYLYIPGGKNFDDVKIDVGGGVISIGELNAREVELNAGAGIIASEKINCRDLSVEVGAGEVVLEGIEADEIDIEVGIGAADIKGRANRKIDASCGMGYLSLQLDNAETDFNYEIECSAGAVSVGDKTYGAMMNEVNVDNKASGECYLECAMGSIDVTFTK